MVTTILVSSTAEEATALLAQGPRRDFAELARVIGADVVYRPSGRKRSGVWGRLAGAHVRQAWNAAAAARPGDRIFADGEHVGLPLALFLAVRRKPRVNLVMLGHFVTKRWKVAAFRLARRAFPGATVLVHSVRQRTSIEPVLSGRWKVGLIPYHVDTSFWRRPDVPPSPRPIVLAVGSEGRDYATLVDAARGLEADVVIAAGSHWARATAGVGEQPGNVTYISETLSFAGLRDLYTSATVLAVPLRDVPNQSGVTAILEAMSMGLPVVVTATDGQRECVAGPLVDPTGRRSPEATADRGPWVLDGGHAPAGARANGLYVPPGDAGALRAAIQQLLSDQPLRDEMGQAGRAYAERYFDTSRFVGLLAAALEPGPKP